MNKKILPLLLVAILATGCSNNISQNSTNHQSDENTVSVVSESAENDKGEFASSVNAEKINEFLATEPSYVDIIAYLNNNITEYDTANSQLLERYILAAESQSYELSRVVFEQDFLNTLNITLGGTLDASKISNIEDPTLKSTFQDAVDGILTIVRYEEVPVFEVDYSKLSDFNNLFDITTQKLIEFNAKLQNYDYVTSDYDLDHDQLANDIVEVEKIISTNPSLFVKSRLQQLMSRQISRLLVGPEGSYLSELADSKDLSATYVGEIASKYDGTYIAVICKGLIDSPSSDFMSLVDIINSYNHFPGDTSKKLINADKEYKGYKYYGFKLEGFDDNITNAIDDIIDSQFDKYIEELDDLQLHQYTYFINDHYLSIGISRTYSNSKSAYNEDQVYLNIDMKTGKIITLDDLFGKEFKDYKDQLASFITEEVDLSIAPSFYLTKDGVVVLPKVEGRSYPNYTNIGLDKLRQFMDPSLLY